MRQNKKASTVRSEGHNLVNVLYVIRGMVEAHLLCAEEGSYKEISKRLAHAEDVMKKVHQYSQTALEITKRFGQYLCLEEATRHEFSHASLHEIWKKVRSKINRSYQTQKIEWVIKIPASFPLVQCNAKDLEEILYSLAANAVEAMEIEEERPRKIIVRAQIGYSAQEKPYAILTLADTGQGILQHQLPFLFRPFFTTKPEGCGNGLGLYFTKELVRKNGGRIAVSSFETYGTTFTLEFKLYQALEENPSLS